MFLSFKLKKKKQKPTSTQFHFSLKIIIIYFSKTITLFVTFYHHTIERALVSEILLYHNTKFKYCKNWHKAVFSKNEISCSSDGTLADQKDRFKWTILGSEQIKEIRQGMFQSIFLNLF